MTTKAQHDPDKAFAYVSSPEDAHRFPGQYDARRHAFQAEIPFPDAVVHLM
jgi:hypothetical protein